MGKKTDAARELSEAIQARLMDALTGSTCDDAALADAEDAISEAVADFERAHPLDVKVTDVKPLPDGGLSFVVDARRPSLEEDADTGKDDD